MADTLELRYWEKTIDFLATPYKVIGSPVFDVREPNAIWHEPLYGDPDVVELNDTYVTFTATLMVTGSARSDITETLSTLKTWVSGRRQRAFASVVPVELAYSRGDSPVMLGRVYFGHVNDRKAHYEYENDLVKATGIVLTLYMSPVAEYETCLYHRNRLFNGDFSTPGSTPTGVPASWTIGSGTAQRSTAKVLVNGFSTYVSVGTTQSLGFHSEDKTSTTAAVASAWLRPTSTSDQLGVLIYDVSGAAGLQAQTLVYSGGAWTGYDATMVDAAGNTWYRCVAKWSGTSRTVDVRIVSGSGTSTGYVSGVYLDTLQASEMPAGWSSYYTMRNRGDFDNSNPTYLTHLDVWGIPGDAPALLKIGYTGIGSTRTTPAISLMSKRTQDRYPVDYDKYWLEDDQATWTKVGSGTLTTSVADATRSSGTYVKYVEGVTNTGFYGDFYSAFGSALGDTPLVDAFWERPRRFLALVYSTSSTATFKASIVRGNTASSVYTVLQNGDTKTVQQTSTWELLDLGAFSLQHIIPVVDDYDYISSPMTLYPRVTVTGMANTEEVRIDALICLWGEEDGFLVAGPTAFDADDLGKVILHGGGKQVVIRGGATVADTQAPIQGSCWTAMPGPLTSRIVQFVLDDDAAHTLGDTMQVDSNGTQGLLCIIPRAYILGGPVNA